MSGRAKQPLIIWRPGQQQWLRENFMCHCFGVDIKPGMICTYVPRGTINPECGCRNYIPPIPFSELKGITYEIERR